MMGHPIPKPSFILRDSRLFAILCLQFLFPFDGQCQNWETLNSGLDLPVRTFHVAATGLYIGGAFKYADSVLVNGISMWNGEFFGPLGSGVSNCWNSCGPILCITEYNGDLYAGGHIFEMGGVQSEGIAKWNGDSWEAVGGGLNGYAAGMAVIDGLLYVGGSFNAAGGIAANGIAVWDGDQWQTIGDFPNTWGGSNWMTVGPILKYENQLYVAGLFPEGNGISHSIARWNGLEWLEVGEGIQGLNTWVNSMVIYEGELHVGGYFFQADGNPGSGIMKWNGSIWSQVGGGVNSGAQITDLIVYEGYLYASGNFSSIADVPADRIAKWNGQQWCGLGSEFNNTINKMVVFEDELYVACGTEVDGTEVNYLTIWTGGDHVDTCGAISGIGELLESEHHISVHPNPNNGLFTVALNGFQTEGVALEVYDLSGRLMHTEQIDVTSPRYASVLDLSDRASGLYMLTITSSKGKQTGKIIIQ